MKKQIKKLSLNKRTISNLSASEMNSKAGGAKTKGHNTTCNNTCNCTVTIGYSFCCSGPNGCQT